MCVSYFRAQLLLLFVGMASSEGEAMDIAAADTASSETSHTAAEAEAQSTTTSDGKLEGAGPNAEDISPEKDGGLWKEIKTTGSGDDQPCSGDTVFVHYVGTLTDGTKFDSSRDRGDQFSFVLGQGKVIKGWDVGVATMKRGELAVLTCRSDYAYGDTGSPPTIPPKATLCFEVELFDWKGEDLSKDQDEGILRTRLHKGEGFESPNDGASCEVHITGRYNDQIFEDRDVSFVVGEGTESGVVAGIDHAIKKFIRGERSKLKIKAEYAYGSQGNPAYNIPAGAELTYEVTLKTFEKAKESWELDTAEKLEQSAIVKDKGTKFFKEGKYDLALKYYEKINSFLEYEEKLEGEEAEKRQALMLAAHLNCAMCHLKTGKHLEAMNQCDKALELDPKNEKGYFRRASAHMKMKNYEEAIADFKKVLEVDPENKAAKNQITLAQRSIKMHRDKEKQTYAGMFTKFAELDAKKKPKEETKSEESKETKNAVENGEQNSGECAGGEGKVEEGTAVA